MSIYILILGSVIPHMSHEIDYPYVIIKFAGVIFFAIKICLGKM